MPPSQIQTGILWQTEEEAGRRCSLCRALSGHSRPAGLSLHSGNFGIHTLFLRQDCRWWQIPLPGETSQHLSSKSTFFNQPSPGFHLGPVRRKRFLGSASSGQLVLVSAQRRWCSFLLLVRDETREEQGRQIKFLWVHFPLPHSLLQACRDFPMRKCISAWSGKGFFLIVWLPSRSLWLTSLAQTQVLQYFTDFLKPLVGLTNSYCQGIEFS